MKPMNFPARQMIRRISAIARHDLHDKQEEKIAAENARAKLNPDARNIRTKKDRSR
mgnify:CR=1 FL=1